MNLRLIWILLLAVTLIWGCKTDKTPFSAVDDSDPHGEEQLLAEFKADEGAGVVKVMSRNVYIGTDVDLVLEAEDINSVPMLVQIAYQLLQSTDFSSRAVALAEEISKTRPHLIGLQEMSKFYIQSPGDMADGGMTPATDLFLDFFEILMEAIEAKGLNYEMAAVVKNANVELPMFTGADSLGNYTFDDIRIEDHDVILVRSDVNYSNPVAVNYDSMLVVDPSIGLVIPRGYVKVNAQVGQTSLVFANTHIEAAPDIDLRMAQVTQLLDVFNDETLPVIIVGDFNSRATTGTTYNHVLYEGYTDTWIDNPLIYNTNGYTFGHQSHLRNEGPEGFMDRRIDFVFAGPQGNPTIGEGFVLGDEKRDKTASGLWPSDHAGVVTKLTYSVAAKLASN